jgi:hypothetical protein
LTLSDGWHGPNPSPERELGDTIYREVFCYGRQRGAKIVANRDFESSAVSNTETIAATESGFIASELIHFRRLSKNFIMPNSAQNSMPNNSQSDRQKM